jgi:hypothetical protein
VTRKRQLLWSRRLDALPQRLALQQLHYDEGLPFVFLHFVNGANIGVIQRGNGARFALETLQRSMVP